MDAAGVRGPRRGGRVGDEFTTLTPGDCVGEVPGLFTLGRCPAPRSRKAGGQTSYQPVTVTHSTQPWMRAGGETV